MTDWKYFEEQATAAERHTSPLHARLVRLLLEVEQGAVVPVYDGSDGEDHWYRVGGWTVVAFDDAGDFDYIDRAISPEGEVLDFDDMPRCTIYDEVQFLPAGSYGGARGGWLGCSHDRWNWRAVSRYCDGSAYRSREVGRR